MNGSAHNLRETHGSVFKLAVALTFLSAFALTGCSQSGGGSRGESVTSGLDGADNPALAMSGSGYAFAVWDELNTGTDVAANSYVPLAEWGLIEFPAEVNGSGDSDSPDVAMPRFSQDALVVWRQTNQRGLAGVYARFFDGDENVWGDVYEIFVHEFGEYVFTPRVALDGRGNAVVVWVHKFYDDPTSPRFRVLASRFVAAEQTWTKPLRIDNADELGLDALAPRIAMNERGSGVVSFLYMEDSETFQIYAALLVPPFDLGDPVWSRPVAVGIPPVEGGNVAHNSHRASKTDDDESTIVWEQRVGETSSIYVNRNVPGEGWSGATRLGTGERPDLATEVRGGDSIVVWTGNEEGEGEYDEETHTLAPGPLLGTIYARALTRGEWEPTEIVHQEESATASSARVAMGVEGDAMVVWILDDGARDQSIIASHRIPGEGWEVAQPAEDDDGKASSPLLATDFAGAYVLVWVRTDDLGVTDIWAADYDPQNGWGLPQLP